MSRIRHAVEELLRTDQTFATIPPTLLLTALGIDIDNARTIGAKTIGSNEDRDRTGAPGEVPSLRLGRFELGRELGSGGMGRVVEAFDPELRRHVAVKTLHEGAGTTPAHLARFVAEAQITAQLDHPNIVPVHELLVSEDGQVCIVMKRVRGQSLREILDGLAAGDPECTARWSRLPLLMAYVFVCGAVAYAHERGVLHRDLKPDNIMFGEFMDVLVMDWGVARLIGDRSEEVQRDRIDRTTVCRTLDGSVIGTPGYMSPEQVAGDLSLLDARSDVWSLGAILWEILTLRPAYPRTDPMAVMLATLEGPPVDPREAAPNAAIPDTLAEAAMKAMSMQREDRFANARDLARAVGVQFGGAWADFEARGAGCAGGGLPFPTVRL